jgi:hypothetical protein
MRAARPLAALLFLLMVTGAAGCKRADCVSVCEAREKALKCGRANCKAKCDQLHNPPACKPELAKFEACLLKEPADHWFCDEEYHPALKESACPAERLVIMKCLQSPP